MSASRRRGPRRRTVEGVVLSRFLACASGATIRQRLGTAMELFGGSPALVRATLELQKQRGEHGEPVTPELIDDARQALAAGAVYGGSDD